MPPPDSVTVEVEVIRLGKPAGRLQFADVLLTIAGIEIRIAGVRVVADRDGRREVLPPLHASGKGALVTGWELPGAVSDAIAEMVLAA